MMNACFLNKLVLKKRGGSGMKVVSYDKWKTSEGKSSLTISGRPVE